MTFYCYHMSRWITHPSDNPQAVEQVLKNASLYNPHSQKKQQKKIWSECVWNMRRNWRAGKSRKWENQLQQSSWRRGWCWGKTPAAVPSSLTRPTLLMSHGFSFDLADNLQAARTKIKDLSCSSQLDYTWKIEFIKISQASAGLYFWQQP